MLTSFQTKFLVIAFLAGLTANGADLQFDAATIKVNNGPPMGQGAQSVKVADGRVTIINIPLRMLIRQAFLGPRDTRPIIGSEVLDQVRVDLIGKAESPNASIDDLRVMIQSLLKDRMKLVSHIESKDMPAYALTLAGNASKLVETPGDAGRCESKRLAEGNGIANRLDCHAVSMAQFASQLTTMVERPVVDRTALAGNRSFSLEYEIQGDAPAAAFAQPLRDIGLRLAPQNLPVPVLVIDSIASTPQE